MGGELPPCKLNSSWGRGMNQKGFKNSITEARYSCEVVPCRRKLVVVDPAEATADVSLQRDRDKPVFITLPNMDRKRWLQEIHRIKLPLPEHYLHIPVKRLLDTLLSSQFHPLPREGEKNKLQHKRGREEGREIAVS